MPFSNSIHRWSNWNFMAKRSSSVGRILRQQFAWDKLFFCNFYTCLCLVLGISNAYEFSLFCYSMLNRRQHLVCLGVFWCWLLIRMFKINSAVKFSHWSTPAKTWRMTSSIGWSTAIVLSRKRFGINILCTVSHLFICTLFSSMDPSILIVVHKSQFSVSSTFASFFSNCSFGSNWNCH